MHIRPRLTASIAALTLAQLAAPPVIAAPVQPEAPAGATTCAFSAWANYDKPSITVRDAPSASAKALGQIPVRPAAGEPEYSYSVTFDVKEAKDGWLRIANASDAYNEDEYPERAPRKLYKGEGWIRADDARVGIQSARGYAKPDAASQRLVDLGSDWLTEMGKIQGIRACHEDWVLLDYLVDRKRSPQDEIVERVQGERLAGRAWFRGLCDVQETSCDMKSVDR
ncbi:hypothetical protein [Achromobacter xylosoxidans]|uniref:hypothetical protein n=1 Tax=Alcaligenes xylosoxydans xylosoxydans TaxID=85698 RepID=UPI000761AF50|nr:hypothetical protein [Achromobacter xylosoxidans]KWU22039.1 hypothetical protein AS148_05130 [Achromobacter xylosoxidans]